jgi:hypothetical protein
MVRRAFYLTVATVLAVTAGCGGGGPESLYKAQIDEMNEYADAVEKGDTAEVREVEARMESTKKKLAEVKLSEADWKGLMEKYRDEYMKAEKRMWAAQRKQTMRDLGLTGK